ncbi:unnamed protein product [Polarella glacialis]|uniref:Uncharacterized protein n=1 Tax=Polarella glacialis TaxID=89957 RepID=A0A813KBQ5_POLGL|nr:unnamed protein product [Polarella glacialis]
MLARVKMREEIVNQKDFDVQKLLHADKEVPCENPGQQSATEPGFGKAAFACLQSSALGYQPTMHIGSERDFPDHYQGQLQELKKTMVGDVQRMQDEVKRHFAQQKAENGRLQQQVTTLKGEKTSLQQQILGLQRRIQEIEEQVGAD